MNYLQKLQDATPPRRSLKGIMLSFIILAAVFFLNTNYAPYFIGMLAGIFKVDPQAIPFDIIRIVGNVTLFVVFMIVSSRYTLKKPAK